MMTRERHRRRSPESSRRRRKERRDSREQLQIQQIPMPIVRYDERADPIDQSRALSPLSSSSSTSSSLLNISRPSQGFGLGRFFSGSSRPKQHRVKKKRNRFLKFGNSSSSSVGSDLAYGKGYIERRRSREFSPPSSYGRPALTRQAQTDEEILELGRKFAEIARQQNAEDLRAAGRTRPSALVGAAAALSQFRRTNSGHSNRGAGSSKPRRDSSPDDSEWESASDDDDSSSSEFDSGLAYGSGLSLQSVSAKQLPPPTSPRSLQAPYEPPLHRKPSVVDPNLFGPINSLRGYVETPCGFEKVDRSTVVDGHRPYEPSIPPSESESRPLQRVYPVPTSDPDRFDAGDSVVSSQRDLSTRSRPAPVPIQPPTIQQPRPIAPVSRKVLDSVETESRYSDRSLSKRVLEEAAVAGVAGAAVGAALGSERRDDREKRDSRRERDGKRRSKRSDTGGQGEKVSKRRSRDELHGVREVQDEHLERSQEKRSLYGQESEKERLWREKVVPELKRESEKEGRRRDDYPDDAYDYDRVRVRREEERKEDRQIDRTEAPREERREGRRDERRDEERASRAELASHKQLEDQGPSREGPIDPFQFQVADDAFQTPLYTTPKRPLTPNVITVDREPDFSRFELREEDAHPQDRLSRRDSYERELREAREAYEAAEHATAPVSEAAFAAAAATVIAEERRGRSRSRGSDSNSRNRSYQGESPKRERDTVIEDANRYYREAELARRIREEEERSRSNDESSVVDKWKQERKQAAVEIVSPPEMAHPKKRSPYDGPDADVRIDNVLEHPNELSRFRVPEGRGRSKTPVFRARDPSAERERPMLNVVRPTPIPSPMPEEQHLEREPSSQTAEKVDSSTSKAIPDVVISSRGEVVPAPPKAVTWGENQTKHYVVESPEREDDPYSGVKIVTPAKTPKSRPAKKSAWGMIASAISGGGSETASSSVSDRAIDTDPVKTRRASRDQEKSMNRGSSTQFESTDETPPIPGPKPPSPRSAPMPGSFAEDPAFTANIAAALEGSGFDPNIVIDDASFHRRDSPPGSNDSGVYRSPFAESVTDLGTTVPTTSQNDREHGFVIGEVETPSNEKDISTDKSKILFELNKEEQRQQEKAVRRDSSEKREVIIDNGKAVETSRPIVEDDWDTPSSTLSKKEKKRREKAARAQTLEDERAVDDSSRKGQALEAEFLGASGADEDEDSSLKRKKSKKSQKAIVVQDDSSRQPDVADSSKVIVPVDAFQDVQDAKASERPKVTIPVNAFQDVQEAKDAQLKDTWDASKKSRRESKRDRELHDSPSRPVSKPEISEDSSRGFQSEVFSTPDYERDSSRKKSTRSRRDSESYGSPSRSVLVSELSRESSYKVIDTDSIPATEEEWDTPRRSRKSKRDSDIYDSPSRSAPASEASLELVRKPTDPDAISLPDDDILRKSNKNRRGTIDYEFTRSPFQSAEDLSTPKNPRKFKQDSVFYDSPSRVESIAEDTVESPKEMTESSSEWRSGETATVEEPSTPKKSKKKSKRDSVAQDDLPSTPVSQSAPPSEVSTSSKKPKRDSGIYDSPSRSTLVSDRGVDDSPKKSKKKKRRNTAGDFPENGDKPDESEPPDRGRDQFDVSERDISSVVSVPTRSDSHRSSKSRTIEDVMDETRSMASSPSGSDRKDRKGSKSAGDKRSGGGSSFLDRFKSSIGRAEEKSRKSEEDKKNSFLDNADTLGAGVGSTGVAVTPTSQESRSNATNVPLEEEAQTVPFTPVRQSTLPLESEFIDPEIAPREIRPAIDPTYGDLLPLPPSRTGSPVPELGDAYPDLPDSRPETPERERHLREIQTHNRRRSTHETPTRPRTPSQSAIPIQFRLGHRHTPSNGRSSPLVSPIVANAEFGSESRSRSRPTSWESSRWEGHREFKPLLLLQRASRGSIGSIDTSSSPERDLSPSESEIREHRSASLRRLLAGDSPDRNVQLRDSPLGTPVESIPREPGQAPGVKTPVEISHSPDHGFINKHSDESSHQQDIEAGDSHLPPVPEVPALESAEDAELISPKSKSIESNPMVSSSDIHPPLTTEEPNDAYIPSSPSPAPAERSANFVEGNEDSHEANLESVAREAETTMSATREPESVTIPDDHGSIQENEFVDTLESQNKDATMLEVVPEGEASKSTDTLVTAPQSVIQDSEAVEMTTSSGKPLKDDKIQERKLSKTEESPRVSTNIEAPLVQEESRPGAVPEQVEPTTVERPKEDVPTTSMQTDSSGMKPDVKQDMPSSSQPSRQGGWFNKLKSSWGTGLTSWSKPIAEGTENRNKEEHASTSASAGAPPSGSRILEELKKRRSEEVTREISSTSVPEPESKLEPAAEASNDQQSTATTSKKGKKKKKRKSQSQITEPSLDQPVITDSQDGSLGKAPTQAVDDIPPADTMPIVFERESPIVERELAAQPESSTTTEQPQKVEAEIPGRDREPSNVETENKPAVRPETSTVREQSQIVQSEIPTTEPEASTIESEGGTVESEPPIALAEAQTTAQREISVVEPGPHSVELEQPVVEPETSASHAEVSIPEPKTVATEPELANIEPKSTIPEKEASTVQTESSTQRDIYTIEQEIHSVELEHPIVKSEASVVHPELRVSEPETSSIEPEQTLVEPPVADIEPESILSELENKESFPIELESTTAENQSSSIETETSTKPETSTAEPHIALTKLGHPVVESEITSSKPDISTLESNESAIEPTTTTVEPTVSVIEELVTSEVENKESFTTEPEIARLGMEPTSGEKESSNVETKSSTQPESFTAESEIRSPKLEVSVPELNSTTELATIPIEPTLSAIETEQVTTGLESKETSAAQSELIVEPDLTIGEREQDVAEVAPVTREQQSASAQEQLAIVEAEKSQQPEPILESPTSVSKKEKRKKRKGKKQQSLESELSEPATPLEESLQLAEQLTQESIVENPEVPSAESQTGSQDQLEAALQESHEVQPSLPEETPSTPKKSKKKKKGKKAQTVNSEPEVDHEGERNITQVQESQPLSGEISSLLPIQEHEGAPETEAQIPLSLPGITVEAEADQKGTEQQLSPPDDKILSVDRSDAELERVSIVAAPVVVREDVPLEQQPKLGEGNRDDKPKSQEVVSQNESVEPTLTESKADILTDVKPTLPSNLEQEQSLSALNPVSEEAELPSEAVESEKSAEVSILNEGPKTEQEHVGQHTMETSLQSPVDQKPSGSKSLEKVDVDESLPQPNVLGGEHARDQQVPASIDPPEAPLQPSNLTEELQQKSPAQIEAVEEPVALPLVGEETQSSSVSNQPIVDESREMALSQPESSSKKKGKRNKKRQDTLETIDTSLTSESIEEPAPQATSLEASVNDEALPVSDVPENPAEQNAEPAEPAGDDLRSELTSTAKKSKRGQKKRKDSDTIGLTNEPELSKAEEPLAEPESQPGVEIVQEPLLEQVDPTTGDVSPEVDSSGSKSEKNRQGTDIPTLVDEPDACKPVDEITPVEQPAQEPKIVETGAESRQSIADSDIPTTSQTDATAGDELEKTQVPEVEPTLSKKQKKKNKKKRGSQIEPAAGDTSQEVPENLDTQGNANDEATPPTIAPAIDVDTIASDTQVHQAQDETDDILSTSKESKDGEEQQTQSRVNTEEITASPIVAPEISAEPSTISEEIRQPEKEDLDSSPASTSPKKSKNDKKKKKRQSTQLAEPSEQSQMETPAEELGASIPASDLNTSFKTDWATADIPPPPAFWSELKDQPDDAPANVGESLKAEVEPFQGQQIDTADQLLQHIETKEQSEILTGGESKPESQDSNLSTIEGQSIQKDTEVGNVGVGEVKDEPLAETLPRSEVDNLQPSSGANEVVSAEQQDIEDQKLVEKVASQEPVTQGESQVSSTLSDQGISTQDTLPTQYTLPTETSITEISQPKDEIDSAQPSSDEAVPAEQRDVTDWKPIETIVEYNPIGKDESLPRQDSTAGGIEQSAEIQAESDVITIPQADESTSAVPVRAQDDQTRGTKESIILSDSQAEPSSTQDAVPASAEDELPVATKKSKKERKRKSKTQDTLDLTTEAAIPTTEPSTEIPPSKQIEIPSTASPDQAESVQIVPDVPITTEPEELAPQLQEDDSQNVLTKKSKKDKKKKKRASQVLETEPEPESSTLPTEQPLVERPQSPARQSIEPQDAASSNLPSARETEMEQPSNEEMELSNQIETATEVLVPVSAIPEPESQVPQTADPTTRPQEMEQEPVIQTKEASADMPIVEVEPEIPPGEAIVNSRDEKEAQHVADIPQSAIPEEEPVSEPPALENKSLEVVTAPTSKKDKKKKKKRGSQAALDDTVSAPSQDVSEFGSGIQTPADETKCTTEGAIPIASEDIPSSIPDKEIEPIESAPIALGPEFEPQISTKPEPESLTPSQPMESSAETSPSNEPPMSTEDMVPIDEGLSAEPTETLPKSTDELPIASMQDSVTLAESLPTTQPVEATGEQIVREPSPESSARIPETAPTDGIATTPIPSEPITESVTQPEAVNEVVEEQSKKIIPSTSPKEQGSATPAQESVRPDEKSDNAPQATVPEELAQPPQLEQLAKPEDMPQPTESTQLDESSKLEEQEQVQASETEKLHESLQPQELANVEEPLETKELIQPESTQTEPLETETSAQPEESMQLVEEPSTILEEPEIVPAKKSKKDRKKKKKASQAGSEVAEESQAQPEQSTEQDVSKEPLKLPESIPDTESSSTFLKESENTEPEIVPVSEEPTQQPLSEQAQGSLPVDSQPIAKDSTTIATDAVKAEDVPEASTSKKSKKKKKRASQIESETGTATPLEPQAQPVLLDEPLVQEPLKQPESQAQVEEPFPVKVEENLEEISPYVSSSKKSKKERRKAKQLAASTTEREPKYDLIVENKPASAEVVSSHIEQPTEPVNPISESEIVPEEKLQAPTVAGESSSQTPVGETTSAAGIGIPMASKDVPPSLPEKKGDPVESATIVAEQEVSKAVQAGDLTKDQGKTGVPPEQEQTLSTPEQDEALPQTEKLSKDAETVTAIAQDPTNTSPSFLPTDPEKDEKETQVPSTPVLSTQEGLNVDLQPQDLPDTEKQDETSLGKEPVVGEAPKEIPDSSLPKEPEPELSPVSRKKSKKKKKKGASAQAEAEPVSEIPVGTSSETTTTEHRALEPESTITNEGEWPESPSKPKKDKKRRKASGTSTPMESMEDIPANAPSETVTQENAPERLTLEAIPEVEGQSSIAKDLEISPKPEGQEKNAEDVNISHPIRETVAVSENVELTSPAADEQRTQLNERPTNETAQDIPSQVEVSLPVSRPRTPTTTAPPAINVDLSPAQLSSHVEHDRPFDQSTQPGKKARTHLSSDDATIPELLSNKTDILPQETESSSHEVSESLQLTEDRMTGIEPSDTVPQDITPAREIAASYLESHPVSTGDNDTTAEEDRDIDQISNAGLLPAISPQREIAASYLEGHSTSGIQIDDKKVEANTRDEVSDTPMLASEDIPTSQIKPQPAQPKPEHAEKKTLLSQVEDVRQPISAPDAAPSAREIAADIMESRPQSSRKGKEMPKDVESTTIETIHDALETGGALLSEKSASTTESKKGKKRQKSIDKRTPDTDDRTGPSTEVGEQAKAATPEPMVIEPSGNLPSQDSIMENAESPVVGREAKRDLPETRDFGHQSPTRREPPASEIIEKLDDLDTSEHANEPSGPKRELKADDKSLKSISPRLDYSSSGRSSPRVLPPVEEETHEELQKEQQRQGRDVSGKPSIITGPITVPNRDSGFSSDSPHPKRRSFVDPSLRDSGVHLRDWPESTPKKENEQLEEEHSANHTPQPNERRSKKLGLGSETPKLETPVTRSLEDEAKDITDPKKPLSSKYGEVGQRSVSDNISRSSTPRTENQGRRSASNTSISRLRTPEPLQFRPNSPGRSSFRPGTNTPPLSLRRVDKRMSGDLRSLSSNLSNNSASRENLHQIQHQSTTPIANEGRVRAKDMTDVYDGYGEGRIGSPRSPTRPQSMRRRQSMQVLELESKVEQLIAENRALADAKIKAEQSLNNQNNQVISTITERDAEIESLKASLEWLRKEVTRLTEVNEGLHSANNVLALQHNEKYGRLESQHASTHKELEELRFARGQYTKTLQEKDAEIQELRAQLEATKEQVREMQRQILASKPPDADFLRLKDEDHFDHRCQQLCSHVQQWVLRFSKFSDMRACRLTSEINDEKIIDRLDNSVLDGSDVDDYLRDRVRRRDIFMSMTMNMIWEFVFTRYLFGMDREQRQKLKSLEKLLLEVGPPQAVRQWRAVTLTLLSKRPAFGDQRNQDTEAVVQAIFQTLCMILPPPSNLEGQIQSQLRRVMREAVDLSIEMRTQRAEYMMLPPLQPEYDANGDLAKTVTFNAALMNERSGDKVSNEEYEAQGAIVRIVLFPLVVKKGDDNGVGDEEIVICPAQVLVAKPPRHATIRMVTPSSEAGGVPLSRGATPSVGLPGSNVSLQMQDAPPLPIPTPPRDDYI